MKSTTFTRTLILAILITFISAACASSKKYPYKKHRKKGKACDCPSFGKVDTTSVFYVRL